MLQMQKDWHPENFAHRFAEVLEDLGLFAKTESGYAANSAGNVRTSSELCLLQVRETPTPSPEPKRTLLTEVRARLSLRYRLRKILNFEIPSTPEPEPPQPFTLKRELAKVRQELWYVSEVKESEVSDRSEHRKEGALLYSSFRTRKSSVEFISMALILPRRCKNLPGTRLFMPSVRIRKNFIRRYAG